MPSPNLFAPPPPESFTLKSLTFPAQMFRRHRATKQFSFVTKPFSASAQTTGNTAEVSNCLQAAQDRTIEWRDLNNARDELHPDPGPHPVRPLDGGSIRLRPAGRRHILLDRRLCRPRC